MPAEDGGLRRTFDGSKEVEEKLEVGMMRGSQSGPDHVQDGALPVVQNGSGNIAPL
jgi:hypothetical protein